MFHHSFYLDYCKKQMKALILMFPILEDICAECDIHATCVHGKCRCRHGYEGDGYECVKKSKFHYPVDTGRKLNAYKTFRRRPGCLLNVVCTFNLRPVSTG